MKSVIEVCSGGELPEVEIISLLEEQIPRYRLRADTLTQFQGKYKQINIYMRGHIIGIQVSFFMENKTQ